MIRTHKAGSEQKKERKKRYQTGGRMMIKKFVCWLLGHQDQHIGDYNGLYLKQYRCERCVRTVTFKRGVLVATKPEDME